MRELDRSTRKRIVSLMSILRTAMSTSRRNALAEEGTLCVLVDMLEGAEMRGFTNVSDGKHVVHRESRVMRHSKQVVHSAVLYERVLSAEVSRRPMTDVELSTSE